MPKYISPNEIREQDRLSKQLENSYYINFIDGDNEEVMLGIPSVSEQIVAQSLRLNQMSGEIVEIVFDNTIIQPLKYETEEEQKFQQELKRFEDMSEEAKERLLNKFAEMTKDVGFGENVHGFAYDPKTGESVITGDCYHTVANKVLSNKLEATEEDYDRYERRRILYGLIFTVEEFSVPIFRQAYNNYLDDNCHSKSIHFLSRQQDFIPIDYEGNIIKPISK